MYQDFLIIALIVPNPLPIQGKHTVAEVIVEVLSVTKLSKIIKKKTSIKTSTIASGGFSGYVI